MARRLDDDNEDPKNAALGDCSYTYMADKKVQDMFANNTVDAQCAMAQMEACDQDGYNMKYFYYCTFQKDLKIGAGVYVPMVVSKIY